MSVYRKKQRKAQVEGIDQIDNTSDVNKPVSTAQAAEDALNLKISSNLSDLNNTATARTNLDVYSTSEVDANALPSNATNAVTHSADGVLNIDFASYDYITLTLDANITTLSFSNLPLRKPVYLRIEQNASTGYAITTITDLNNPDGIAPDFSTVADENSLWQIMYMGANNIRIIGEADIV